MAISKTYSPKCASLAPKPIQPAKAQLPNSNSLRLRKGVGEPPQQAHHGEQDDQQPGGNVYEQGCGLRGAFRKVVAGNAQPPRKYHQKDHAPVEQLRDRAEPRKGIEKVASQ